MAGQPSGFIPDPPSTTPPGFISDPPVPSETTVARVNEQPVPVEDKNDLATLGRRFWEQVNPIAQVQGLAKAIESPEAVGQTIKTTLQAQGVPLTRAQEAYSKGDYGGAAIHALNYLLPLVGPILDEAGLDFRKGQYAAGTGRTLGLGTNLVAPAVVPKVVPPVARAVGQVVRAGAAKLPGVTRPLPGAAMTPEQIAFLRSKGVDVSAAMATDNPAVQGPQFLADRSLGGAWVASTARDRQAEALGTLGQELATEAHPTPVTPPQAGLGVESSMRGLIETMTGQAGEQYAGVRQAQAASTPVTVETAAAGSTAFQRLFQKLQDGAPGHLTRDELYVMRQIEAELDAQRYSRGTYVDADVDTGLGGHYAPGSANADVYHDLNQAAQTSLTGGELRTGIGKTLETGTWNTASRAALEVARKRLGRAGGDVRQVVGPNLGPEVSLLGSTTQIQFPTYLQVVKEQLQPVFQALDAVAQSTPAAMLGSKADAYVALKRLIEGPDVVSLTTAEDLLGAFKDAARADIKELRTPGQGIFADAVKRLQEAVDDSARQAGPEVLARLKAGRQITAEKYGVAKVHEGLREGAAGAEGQPIHKQLTARDDSAISYLRQVRDVAPAEIPKVARAYLDEILGRVEGPADWAGKAKGIVAEWRKLGPETKQILYGAELTQSLDHFFNAIDRLGKTNVNPSGSGWIAGQTAQAVALLSPFAWTGLPAQGIAALVAKGLRSRAVVDALTQGLLLPTSAPAARVAAARLQLQRAAERAGVAWPALTVVPKGAGAVPRAAQADQQQ